MKNPWFLCLILLFVPLLASANGKCTSINDRYCDGHPLITANGAKAEIQVSTAKEYSYKRTHSEQGTSCGGACKCKAEVRYVHLEGKGAGIDAINSQEKQQAKKMRCSFDNTFVIRRPDFVSTSPTLVSTAIFNEEYCRDCGGGCHGNTLLATYDAAKGKKYVLGDVIAKGDLAAVKNDVSAEYTKRYVPQEQHDYVNKFLPKDIDRNLTPDAGIYVENDTVYVSVTSFTLGCAAGSFYPVPVPAKYIQPEFRKRMGISH
ncbi:MAG: hypothetical protein EB060_02390 [Proteobacteria bacterium]|nr:hypothetical protein [Pseudomonadota bacterium]